MAKDAKQSKHDWGLVIAGVILFLLACLILAWPGFTLVTIAIMAGVTLLFAGGADISRWSRIRGEVEGSAWIIVGAVLDILLGIMFIFQPIVSAEVIPWMAGIFLIAYGIVGIVTSIGMRKSVNAWWAYLILSIVGIIVGIMFMTNIGSFVLFLSIFLMVRALSLITFGILGHKSFLD